MKFFRNIPRIEGVTGVILAGGASSRMGSNKALLPYGGGVLIEEIHGTMRRLFGEVLVVTNSPEQYRFLPCRKVPDLYPGMGALAGVHAALVHSRHPAVFVAACDMPRLNPELIEMMAGLREGHDVVLPRTEEGLEPLHAIYDRRCLPAIEASLQQGRRRIVSFLPSVEVREVSAVEMREIDPHLASFSNINTPEEYLRLREPEQTSGIPPAAAAAA